jgi:hypothetical protein
MADKRTVLEFEYEGDLWAVVDDWAKTNGYKQRAAAGDTRVFQRGVGFWVAPQMLHIEKRNGNVHMEAWIRSGLFVRALSLFILPAEIHIRPGGMRAALPRKMARDKVNLLLEQLRRPLIA